MVRTKNGSPNSKNKTQLTKGQKWFSSHSKLPYSTASANGKVALSSGTFCLCSEEKNFSIKLSSAAPHLQIGILWCRFCCENCKPCPLPLKSPVAYARSYPTTACETQLTDEGKALSCFTLGACSRKDAGKPPLSHPGVGGGAQENNPLHKLGVFNPSVLNLGMGGRNIWYYDSLETV